ncbi:MAG TPA: L,D-transpeptidase family protein [Pyrinomonadaceae bacterium]|nr:L,D-transpeptidase family protein [Pyrinomonadaceae bacterium]
MNRSRNVLCALVLAGLLGASACVSPGPESGGVNTNANPNANAARPTPAAPTTAARAGESDLPVTLPVLDAMFAEENFAGELKSRLQLTDEQVNRLREVAGEATSELSEEEQDRRSTAEATRRATEKIKEVLGEQKAGEFAALVRERWSGGEGAALAAKPNAVPADTRIVVNAPAYRMDVFENGRLVKTYRVGIGYPEFPLPQGLRKADTIIFNPTWTPPDEPWVRGKVRPGKTVEAGSKLNPLGPIKIPIGLPSLIHGGKAPARLGTFASHGCVGLTDAQVQDFSVVLAGLGGAQLTPEDVKTYGKQKTETKNVKLQSAVPVELRYETIVVEDGKLKIYRDVYDKGTNTEENLRAVLEVFGVRLEDLSEQERAQVAEALKAMARDARGNPADGQATPTPTPGRDGRVAETRTVKGEKEMVVEIAALRGKGYPAPVSLDAGGQQQSKPAAGRQGSRRT